MLRNKKVLFVNRRGGEEINWNYSWETQSLDLLDKDFVSTVLKMLKEIKDAIDRTKGNQERKSHKTNLHIPCNSYQNPNGIFVVVYKDVEMLILKSI